MVTDTCWLVLVNLIQTELSDWRDGSVIKGEAHNLK